MRILLILMCSVILWGSTCLAAIITTETTNYSNGDNTIEIEYPHVELGNDEATSRANDMIGMNVRANGIRFTHPKEGDLSGGEGRCYYTITYNGDDYISLVTTTVSDTGGAHPMVSYKGYIINAQTGYGEIFSRLAPQYANDVSDLVKNGIYHYSDNTPYTGDLIGSVNQRYIDDYGYINEDGILCLLYGPYSIAPWSAGALYIPVCPVKDL